MKTASGKRKLSQNLLQKQRHGLLAKVHIAKKELCIDDALYRVMLNREFGVDSSAALSVPELQSLIRYFESKGWKPKGSKIKAQSSKDLQAEALRKKAKSLLDEGRKSRKVRHPAGLVRKVCRTDKIEWCRDVARLKRLIVVLERINNE